MNLNIATFKRTLLRVIIFACFFSLTACEAVDLLTAPSGGNADVPAPILQSPSTPREVAEAFLSAWNNGDYDSMYGRISAQSQGRTSSVVFAELYAAVVNTITQTGVTYNIKTVTEQGLTAAIIYDATLQSSIFGEIPDPDRTMRLIREGEQWRVAWSTLDILDGYAPGSRLEIAQTRPTRGSIYDRNWEFLVEQGGTVVELYITRQNIPELDMCVDVLATLTHRRRNDITTIFADYNMETRFSIGDIDVETYNAYSGQLSGLCNIVVAERQTRRYAGHGMAAHTIGYIGQIPAEQAAAYTARGYATGDLVGITGVENAYEAELAGSAERFLRIIEPGGLVVRQLAGAAGEAPHNIQLTLNANVQRAAMQAFTDAYNTASVNQNWGSRSTGGGGVMLDVNTGEILALVSFPTFDPSAFSPDTSIFQGQYINMIGSDSRMPTRNRTTQDQYPPGSVFKIVTTAATAGEGIFTPTDMFDCSLEWNGGAYGDTQPVRFDWRNFELGDANFATGPVTMAGALASSCNPFFYQMGALLYRLEPTALINYARRMGLGRSTGLNPSVFPAEAAGQIASPIGPDQNISIAIGQQDTQVSVIQMARLVAGVANGGTLYTPYVVQQVGGENGTEPLFVAEPQVAGNMGLSQQTLDVIYDGMCMVTNTDTRGNSPDRPDQPLGTAWFVFDNDVPPYFPAAYTSCAKTGTAQTGRAEPHGWFVVYAPADNPQVAVAVMTEFSREGSETSAPIARRMLDAYFNQPNEPYPAWWHENSYVELQIPRGSTGG